MAEASYLGLVTIVIICNICSSPKQGIGPIKCQDFSKAIRDETFGIEFFGGCPEFTKQTQFQFHFI